MAEYEGFFALLNCFSIMRRSVHVMRQYFRCLGGFGDFVALDFLFEDDSFFIAFPFSDRPMLSEWLFESVGSSLGENAGKTSPVYGIGLSLLLWKSMWVLWIYRNILEEVCQ